MEPLKSINDLSRHNQPMNAQFKDAFTAFLGKGWYVLGTEVAYFEKEFAAYCGANFAIGVANGTEALEISLRAVGVGSKDKVALVANAGGYGTIAINSIGATPVFVDIDINTFTMDAESLAEVLQQNSIRAIIVTHLYGRLANIEEISRLASTNGVKLVEDCAQAHGASLHGKKAGSWGDVSSFSFYPTKNLGALGDGGAIVTNDEATAATVKKLRQYGWDKKYSCGTLYGRNSRLDELQAAILRVKLPYLDGWNLRRSAVAGLYNKAIQHSKIYLPQISGGNHVAHLYVIRTDQRDALSDHLHSLDIPHDIHYPLADYRQPMFAGEFTNFSLPVTEQLCSEALTLPCFPEMTEEEVHHVAAAVNQWKA